MSEHSAQMNLNFYCFAAVKTKVNVVAKMEDKKDHRKETIDADLVNKRQSRMTRIEQFGKKTQQVLETIGAEIGTKGSQNHKAEGVTTEYSAPETYTLRIRGYAVELDHPSPEFLECVGEWIRGYAVELDHPSPRIF